MIIILQRLLQITIGNSNNLNLLFVLILFI